MLRFAHANMFDVRHSSLRALVCLIGLGSMVAQAQSPVPPSYQPIYNQLDQILDMFNTQLNLSWNGQRTGVDTADESLYGSSNNGELLFDSHNLQECETEITRMKTMGLSTVSLSIHFPYLYQPFWTFAGNPSEYQQFVEFYGSLATYIRGLDMKILIETQTIFPSTDPLSQQVKAYYASLSWNDYIQARTQTAVNIANIMHPDYFTVISEPDTEAMLTGQTKLNSISGILQLVTPMAATVKALPIPNMKVGAGSGTWEKNFSDLVTAIVKSTVSDYYSLHLYPITGEFYPNCVEAAKIAQQYGKSAAIGETWPYKISSYEYGQGISPFNIFRRDPFDFWSPIDAKSLSVSLKMANIYHMLYMSGYWTRYMFSYIPYNSSTAKLSYAQIDQLAHDTAETAMNAGQFTQTGVDWSGYVKGTIPLQ